MVLALDFSGLWFYKRISWCNSIEFYFFKTFNFRMLLNTYVELKQIAVTIDLEDI